MFNISNTKVYGLPDSIIASAFPMDTGSVEDYFNDYVEDLDSDPLNHPKYKRAEKLGSAVHGSGHDCFLKGIVVQYNIRCSHVFLIQFMRYHFHDIISSQSKMHKIAELGIASQCNEYVDPDLICIVEKHIENYKSAVDPKEKTNLFKKALYNIPVGMELTMRYTDNYLQLKSICKQRDNGSSLRLDEWHKFRKWALELPYFKELTGSK